MLSAFQQYPIANISICNIVAKSLIDSFFHILVKKFNVLVLPKMQISMLGLELRVGLELGLELRFRLVQAIWPILL